MNRHNQPHHQRNNNPNSYSNRSQLRKARSLWNETRQPNASLTTYIRAILYECQPIRFSQLQNHYYPQIHNIFKKSVPFIQNVLVVHLPILLRRILQFVQSRNIKEWMYLCGFISYWYIVSYLHELLHAGPMIIILTLLIMIFTIGLGDNSSKSRSIDGEYVSAYSVFNRGFQNILGSLDADNLVAQHVGGGLGAAAVAGGGGGRDNNNDDLDDDDFGNNHNHNRRRRNNNRNHNRQQQQQQQQQEEENNNPPQNNNNNQNNNKSRKSGKKVRRKRNIEQKREQQREMELQREAAAALGFGDGRGLGHNQDEVMAMNRLIEEQADAAAILMGDDNDDDVVVVDGLIGEVNE